MHHEILVQLLIIFSLSVVAVYLCHRFRIAPILGFLITGAVAGPHGLSLVANPKEVELLAEVGVMLLLFTIGLELSLERLVEMKRAIFIGGGLQVGLTISVSGGIAWMLGQAPHHAVFTGFLITLSSTAIVLKVLQERGEVGSAHSGAAVGTLIFQDLIVVPMLLAIPLLAGKSDNPILEVAIFLGEFAIIGLILWFGARRLVPAILFRIVRQRDPELFVLSIIVVGLGVAWLTAMADLSLALGAFLAGLIISESEYGHQAFASILPFRDIFTSLFFVSVGMLLDVGFLGTHLLFVLEITLIVIVLKALLAGGSTFFSGAGFTTAIAVGLSLAQIGEFSFVLAKAGLADGLLSETAYQFFLAVSVMTMAVAPTLVAHAGSAGRRLAQLSMFRHLALGQEPDLVQRQPLKDHLIIIGFGENGRAAVQLSYRRNIPYIVLETNPETVRREKSLGIHIQFGDATREVVLKHVGIMTAKAVLVTVPAATAVRSIVAVARHVRADVTIVARTTLLGEVGELEALGASHVVAMQLEASVMLCQHLLAIFGVAHEDIMGDLAAVRANQILRHDVHPHELPEK